MILIIILTDLRVFVKVILDDDDRGGQAPALRWKKRLRTTNDREGQALALRISGAFMNA